MEQLQKLFNEKYTVAGGLGKETGIQTATRLADLNMTKSP